VTTRESGTREYNWATLPLSNINAETRSSGFRQSDKISMEGYGPKRNVLRMMMMMRRRRRRRRNILFFKYCYCK
jgi:hypothetical protein